MKRWIELQVEVDQEAVEAVSEVLSRYGFGGGIAIDEAIDVDAGGDGYRLRLDQPVRVKTYLPAEDLAGDAIAAIRDALDHLSFLRPIGPLRLQTLEEEDWANAWKEHFHVHHVGQRIVIKPTWREYTPAADERVIELDPGMAFGTGLHPTTRLCLAALEDHLRPGQSVLDLGTGSGILAIAAARLGANPVYALDIDPVAVAVAASNVQANGVESIVRVRQGTLEGSRGDESWPMNDGQRAFDRIVANLIARVLIDLAGPLAAALAADGVLIASGIIADRTDDVIAAFAAAGLTGIERRQEGDWIALIARRQS